MAALSPTDEQLLAAMGRRESGALEVLYDRHHRLALGLARRMLGEVEAAEDVVQEVFLAVWRQAERYRPERGAVKTWLLAMVHHRAIDRLRRRTTSGLTAELSEEQIVAALAMLPVEQRDTIELAYFGGKSQSEIAALLGVPLGTIKGRTRLALEKLRGLGHIAQLVARQLGGAPA